MWKNRSTPLCRKLFEKWPPEPPTPSALPGRRSDLHRSPRSRAFRDPGFHHSSNQNHDVCQKYSVTITCMCLFSHTNPLALSMTWETRSGIYADCRSHKHASEPRIFAFCTPEPCPCRPLMYVHICHVPRGTLYVQWTAATPPATTGSSSPKIRCSTPP